MLFILAERIFVGRSHVAKVAEARLEQINRYCQVWYSQLLHLSYFMTSQYTWYKNSDNLFPVNCT